MSVSITYLFYINGVYYYVGTVILYEYNYVIITHIFHDDRLMNIIILNEDDNYKY